MAQPLAFELTLISDKKQNYWWPLIFAAMATASWTYTAPDLSEAQGYYYFTRFDEGGQIIHTDFVQASFRTMWDEMYAEASQILVSFWPVHTVPTNGTEPFALDVSLYQNTTEHSTILHLTLEDAYLIDMPAEVIKQRVGQLFRCAIALYDFCGPFQGELSWEDTPVPLASFDQPLLMPGEKNNLWATYQVTFSMVQWKLIRGTLSLLDPFPVRIRGGWMFIPLLEYLKEFAVLPHAEPTT